MMRKSHVAGAAFLSATMALSTTFNVHAGTTYGAPERETLHTFLNDNEQVKRQDFTGIGKLFIDDGDNTNECTAVVLGRHLLVTSKHCLQDQPSDYANYNVNADYYDDAHFYFIPRYGTHAGTITELPIGNNGPIGKPYRNVYAPHHDDFHLATNDFHGATRNIKGLDFFTPFSAKSSIDIAFIKLPKELPRGIKPLDVADISDTNMMFNAYTAGYADAAGPDNKQDGTLTITNAPCIVQDNQRHQLISPCRIYPGDSGGPVFDIRDGNIHVIAINNLYDENNIHRNSGVILQGLTGFCLRKLGPGYCMSFPAP